MTEYYLFFIKISIAFSDESEESESADFRYPKTLKLQNAPFNNTTHTLRAIDVLLIL